MGGLQRTWTCAGRWPLEFSPFAIAIPLMRSPSSASNIATKFVWPYHSVEAARHHTSLPLFGVCTDVLNEPKQGLAGWQA
ncbi:hypothetical protein JMJ77_0002299 [Colletotrichum scovillei]|uniref:Uncharacterized protein n=1 Tax=Colletotrichum scovillei TaxID=1209932 RepID=A0A9P7R9B8_9PEZI|nr:hypothetical protein JMJ77_0002299 [Colletotrichum scovillei]KAG7070719.1 hypothetical protein JMJ76_0001965 [Colletotrichum scovillei]KAG7078959.1 hypothetical protein JMJ78_0002622 [Colletotrichum scovillei]